MNVSRSTASAYLRTTVRKLIPLNLAASPWVYSCRAIRSISMRCISFSFARHFSTSCTKDHDIVETVYSVARHMASKHLSSQQGWNSPRLHRQSQISPQHALRVLSIEGQLRCNDPLIFTLRSHSPDVEQNDSRCTHRAPPSDGKLAPHPVARFSRVPFPPRRNVRGAGNSASFLSQLRQYTPFTALMRSQSAPHPSHTFNSMRK